MDCVRDWNCLSTLLSSEKYYGIISILHLSGRLWLWASTTQVRVDMLFDDAWCICTQGGENTSQFHKFQYKLIHLHTLRSFVWDFCVSEALTRGWKVLWMMHGTCTPCWGSVWNDNFDTLKIRLPLRVGSLPLNEQRFTGRDLVLLKAVFVTGWWPNPTLGWQRLGQQGVAFTGGMKVPWIPCSLRCSIVQTLSTSFYILLIWCLEDFCVQVPSRDNILMNLQWSNAQCTLDHTMRVYFVDLV